jgi:fluoroquinolone resistance protein
MIFDDFVSDDEFSSIVFKSDSLIERQFDKCRFVSCTFRETDLRSTVFESCTFIRCDFILPKVEGLTLRAVTFEDSRLMGIPFGECNQFGFNPDFHGCIVDSCMFLNLKLKKKELINNTFRNSDFMECDLREASFSGCLFDNAQFHNCDLREADFREAENYIINPDGNKIKGSKHRIPGALSFLSFTGIDLEL